MNGEEIIYDKSEATPEDIAIRYAQDEKNKTGLIVTFGGSDGGADFDRSIALAKEGYEVVSLFYCGQDNQPESHNNVPLEFFGEFLEYTETAVIDTSTLTLVGISKGAELALILTNYYEEITNKICQNLNIMRMLIVNSIIYNH